MLALEGALARASRGQGVPALLLARVNQVERDREAIRRCQLREEEGLLRKRRSHLQAL